MDAVSGRGLGAKAYRGGIGKSYGWHMQRKAKEGKSKSPPSNLPPFVQLMEGYSATKTPRGSFTSVGFEPAPLWVYQYLVEHHLRYGIIEPALPPLRHKYMYVSLRGEVAVGRRGPCILRANRRVWREKSGGLGWKRMMGVCGRGIWKLDTLSWDAGMLGGWVANSVKIWNSRECNRARNSLVSPTRKG